MTVCAFSRAFKAQFGLTFREYLLRYRIGRACELLKERVHNATDAGIAVGFEDASHFARAFRRDVLALVGHSGSFVPSARRSSTPEANAQRRCASAGLARRRHDHFF